MAKKLIKNLLVYLIAGVLLWYLFKDTDWSGVLAAIAHAHWGWLIGGTLLILLSFFARVQRWRCVVRSVKPVPYRDLFSATQIGFLGNFVLPGRLGEVIRAVVLSRLAALPFSKCFALVVLDRVADLFGFIAFILVTASVFRPEIDIVLPPELDSVRISKNLVTNTASVTILLLVGIIGAFVLLYLNQALALRVSDFFARVAGRAAATALRGLARVSPRAVADRVTALAEKMSKIDRHVHRMVQHFAEGMHVFRSAKDMLKALLFTGLTWGIGMLSYICMVSAFGLAGELPWYTGFMIMTLLSLFISVPGPPGFVGTFHVGIIGALVLANPAIDVSAAKAVAIVAHLLNLFAVVAVGLYCLHRERMGLLSLKP